MLSFIHLILDFILFQEISEELLKEQRAINAWAQPIKKKKN